MQFSIMIVQTTVSGTGERYGEIIEQVQLAEELGYVRVWLVAHEFTDFSRPSSMLTASHLAASTDRIRLGIGVSVLPLQHPLRVAEETTVLDHLSHGRVDLGVGRGIQPEAYAAYGIPMEESTERMWEAIHVLLRVWTERDVRHDGKYWRFPETTVEPRPLQQPHPPLWVVGVSPASIERAAASGFNGLIGTYMNTLDEVEDDLRRWSTARGASSNGAPASPQVAHNELVYVADTDEIAEREAADAAMWYSRGAAATWEGDAAKLPDNYAHWRSLSRRTATLEWSDLFANRSLMGSPETVAAKVRRLAGSGVDELIVFTSFGTLEHAKTLGSMRKFAQHVMGEFSS